jgi:hypothetical protein
MSGGLEGAADAVAAGLVARAVEPHAGNAPLDAHETHGGHCLNCGTTLIGEYCHVCGQSGHVHRSIGAIGHEIAHGVFHFEGKIWHTLPLLALRPGELTRRYAAGERAKFVSPLAIFLFSVFLMFAIVANLPGKMIDKDLMKPDVQEVLTRARAEVVSDLKTQRTEMAELNGRLQKEKAKAEPDPERLSSLAERISRRANKIAELERVEQAIPAPTARPEMDMGDGWFNDKFRYARENPDLVLYKMKTSAYKYSWALIPISIPILWLLFPFSRRFALYDHAIFVTYSLSFMSLLTIVLAVLGAIGVSWTVLGIAGMGIPIVHIYKQLRGAYSIGRAGATVRTLILVNLIFWIIVPIFSVVLVYMGVG